MGAGGRPPIAGVFGAAGEGDNTYAGQSPPEILDQRGNGCFIAQIVVADVRDDTDLRFGGVFIHFCGVWHLVTVLFWI